MESDGTRTVRSNRRRGARGRSVQVRVAWMWDGTTGELHRVAIRGNLHIPLSAIPKLPEGDSIHRVFLELRLYAVDKVNPKGTSVVSADSGGEKEA